MYVVFARELLFWILLSLLHHLLMVFITFLVKLDQPGLLKIKVGQCQLLKFLYFYIAPNVPSRELPF